MIIIPEEKIKSYLKYSKDKTISVICSCGKIVEVPFVPYYYDEENNDVYFTSLCPECGELIITKE